MIYDYREAQLSEQDQALCDYAAKLTIAPGKIRQDDVDQLLQVGFSDAEISIAAQVIGYFNYINRIADGLGVESEDWMPSDPSEWHARKASDYKVD